MISKKYRVASGISHLDHLLEGLRIGDNVVWYDEGGSLASAFCLNFIQASQAQKKSIIYVNFDRSPRNLIEKLGPLSANKKLIILDCFTYGKGAGSEVFLNFYDNRDTDFPCKIIRVDEPWKTDQVTGAFYGVHGTLEGDVRFVFESLTGMQELWGGEEDILNFYFHSCPKLYELNTVAYWMIEKKAHSLRLKAQINQIAQVAIDLSVRRGKTFLTVLKAEDRNPHNLHKSHSYWIKDLNITFDSEKRKSGQINLGMRLKELRTKQGLSQTELAKLVGVTPSTISQVESDLIYPSLTALVKMAEVLSIDVSSFFRGSGNVLQKIIFPADEAIKIKIPDIPGESIQAKLLTPVDFDPKAEPYLIEIPPEKTLPSHFFIHKGDEFGYLLSGELQVELQMDLHTVHVGDVVYLTTEMPSQWKNPGPEVAKLLWIKIK